MPFAVVPTLRGTDWWSAYDPTRIMNQFFGDILHDSHLLAPSFSRGFAVRPYTQSYTNSSGRSEVDNEFKVSLNVSQFKPEELEVKIMDNFVVVHGKHEEKCDEHGFIAREFTRKYMLPEGFEEGKVTSTLTPDNVLVIKAPKLVPPETPKSERMIPIAQEQQSAV